MKSFVVIRWKFPALIAAGTLVVSTLIAQTPEPGYSWYVTSGQTTHSLLTLWAGDANGPDLQSQPYAEFGINLGNPRMPAWCGNIHTGISVPWYYDIVWSDILSGDIDQYIVVPQNLYLAEWIAREAHAGILRAEDPGDIQLAIWSVLNPEVDLFQLSGNEWWLSGSAAWMFLNLNQVAGTQYLNVAPSMDRPGRVQAIVDMAQQFAVASGNSDDGLRVIIASPLSSPIHWPSGSVTDGGESQPLIVVLDLVNGGEQSPCVGTPGYWKNHPNAWPVERVSVGPVVLNKNEALAVMWLKPKGNRVINLLYHLIAAKLNISNGADASCVEQPILDADAWLTQYGYLAWTVADDGVLELTLGTVDADSDAWAEIAPTFELLVQYNEGQLCAPSRDECGCEEVSQSHDSRHPRLNGWSDDDGKEEWKQDRSRHNASSRGSKKHR